MSRDAGFLHADVDTSLMADPKVVALARRLRDPERTAVSVCLFTGLILASWKAGARVTLAEAAPAWYLEPVEAIQADLEAVGLVDHDGRLQAHAWTSWYIPADERREQTRERWRRANEGRRRKADSAVTALPPRGDRGDHLTSPHDVTDESRHVRPLRAADAARGGAARTNGAALRAAMNPADIVEADRV